MQQYVSRETANQLQVAYIFLHLKPSRNVNGLKQHYERRELCETSRISLWFGHNDDQILRQAYRNEAVVWRSKAAQLELVVRDHLMKTSEQVSDIFAIKFNVS